MARKGNGWGLKGKLGKHACVECALNTCVRTMIKNTRTKTRFVDCQTKQGFCMWGTRLAASDMPHSESSLVEMHYFH